MSLPAGGLNPAIVKAYQQQAWAAGDYEMIGRMAVITSEQLCETVDLRAGQRVLDVACGGGNTALAAARRWCEVSAIDYVPSLLEHGRRRAAVERLEVDFREGDAEALPFPGASFDIVLSSFGVMFTPNQPQAAAELLRVCRPGGTIGLTNWTPDSLVGDFFQAVVARGLLPPNITPPTAWGTEERLHELFGNGVSSLAAHRRDFIFRFRSARHYVDVFSTYFGPAVKALERLDPTAREDLTRDWLASIEARNRSGDTTLVAPSAYLEVVATRGSS